MSARAGCAAVVLVALAACGDNAAGPVDASVPPDAGQPFFLPAVVRGTGGGAFGTATVVTEGKMPSAVVAADFDGDGRADVAGQPVR